MTSLGWIGDGEVEAYEREPDVVLNSTEKTVLLRVPSLEELRGLWRNFEVELKEAFLELFSTRNRDVRVRFGLLGRSPESYEGREDDLWGLAPIVFDHPKGFQRIKSGSAVRVLARHGLLTTRTVNGAKRQRLGSKEGGLAQFVARLTPSRQRQFLKAMFDEDSCLDDVLEVGQACEVGMARFAQLVEQVQSAESLLECIAEEARANLLERKVRGQVREGKLKSDKGMGRWYAPIWFALYLAREQIWLLPVSTSSKAGEAYPGWAKPVQLRMCVPVSKKDLIKQILRDFSGEGSIRRGDRLVINQFVVTAACSNIWHAQALRAGPLVGLKRLWQSNADRSNSHRNWALNRIWEAATSFFKVPVNEHPDARNFLLGPKLANHGTVAFNWVSSPHPQNLKTWKRIFGDQPSSMPKHLIRWAEQLREILPLFGVKALENKTNSLNAWLYYIASLGSAAPAGFEGVRRGQHINNPFDSGVRTFKAFLEEHYVEQSPRIAQMAMSDLRQAWQLSALKDGFAERLANPIEPKLDSPVKGQRRRDRTSRKALDSRVLEIIARENMRDGMAFAKAFGGTRKTCWRWVRDPLTGNREEIFFPAAPLIVHIICYSGMRGSQGRWLDTGEGDALTPDLESRSYRKNEAKTATPGRREGFLQLTNIPGPQRENVIGMWVNTGKTGPHEVPWINPDLIPPVLDMIEFQKRWQPLDKPIKCETPDYLTEHRLPTEETSFPLFRDPDNKMGLPLTSAKILDYWRALLVHCQPLVDEAMGYHYPLLLADGSLNFDIHSLRVTIVTTLLDNGVPISVVQMLVGHKAAIMTWYYRDVTNAKVHSALQAAVDRNRAKFADAHSISSDEEEVFIEEVVTLRDTAEFAGPKSFRTQRATGGFIEVFAHGICPGASCDTGGARIAEGRYGPVWRPRACSGCRYRMTGPAFLAGLVQRLNGLMFEIKVSMGREAEINQLIEDAEDRGRPRPDLHSQMRHEQQLRDKLFEEWCLELKTIRLCEAELHEKQAAEGDGKLVLISDVDFKDTALGFQEVHEFALAQTLVSNTRIVEGSQVDLPANIQDYRDRILYRIAHTNNVASFFYSLDGKSEREALDSFGELLLMHAQSDDALQDLIDGTKTLSDLPGLAAELNDVIGEFDPPSRLQAAE